jgi:hypothetical protein
MITDTPTIHWLLIGGPFHGRTLRISDRSQVRVYHEADGEEYLYVAQTLQIRGECYRLGKCYSEDAHIHNDTAIAQLVEKTRLEPHLSRAETLMTTAPR